MKIRAAVLVALCGALVAGCERAQEEVAHSFVGVRPAPPRFDRLSAESFSELSPEVAHIAMPLTGQNNDCETLALLNSERADAIDMLKDVELAMIANSDRPMDYWNGTKLTRGADRWTSPPETELALLQPPPSR